MRREYSYTTNALRSWHNTGRFWMLETQAVGEGSKTFCDRSSNYDTCLTTSLREGKQPRRKDERTFKRTAEQGIHSISIFNDIPPPETY